MARNITVHIASDGVFLRFSAGDGRDAMVNVTQLAQQLDGEARAVLLAWCEDQQKPLLAQDFED